MYFLFCAGNNIKILGLLDTEHFIRVVSLTLKQVFNMNVSEKFPSQWKIKKKNNSRDFQVFKSIFIYYSRNHIMLVYVCRLYRILSISYH